MAAVGIVGGTFNPPHRGHLAIARAARDQLALERVLLMPVHTPPHKREQADPGPHARLQMCRLAAAEVEGVEACDLEVRRGGPSYTVDTLRSIYASDPLAELTFVMGADSAISLPGWREPEALVELARIAVAAREGSDRTRVRAALASVGAGADRIAFLEAPLIDVSASEVRARAAAGEPLSDLVGPAVAGYIVEHGLYGEGEA